MNVLIPNHGLRAAIRYKNMLLFSVPPPERHHDLIRKLVEVGIGTTIGRAQGYEQGFSREVGGGFLTREEAAIAVGRTGKLFTEDLWSTADTSGAAK